MVQAYGRRGQASHDHGAPSAGGATLSPDQLAAAPSVTVTDPANGQDLLSLPSGGPVEVVTGDLRLPTGQAIGDGNNTARLQLLDARTVLADEEGDDRILAAGAGFPNSLRLDAEAASPVRIYDSEGGFDAVQYDTDTSAGVLRTPNAGFAVQGDHGAVDGLNLRANNGSNEVFIDAQNPGVAAYDLRFKGSLYDFSATPADLRLATGQAIEDVNGNDRFRLGSDFTSVRDETGDNRITVRSDDSLDVLATVDSNFRIFDSELGAAGVLYESDTSAGVLRTPNAGLRVEQSGYPDSGVGLEVTYNSASELSQLLSFDRTNSDYKELRFDASVVTLTGGGSPNLRLGTGQAIEDGGGDRRMYLSSLYTSLSSPNTVDGIRLYDTSTQLRSGSDSPVEVYDTEGGFVALSYTTSANAPGTLELTNAELKSYTPRIESESLSSVSSGSTVTLFSLGAVATGILHITVEDADEPSVSNVSEVVHVKSIFGTDSETLVISSSDRLDNMTISYSFSGSNDTNLEVTVDNNADGSPVDISAEFVGRTR